MSTFNKIYKKVANNGNDNDYEIAGIIGVNGVPLDIMKGASSEKDGIIGLVPEIKMGDQNKFLRGDGTWQTPLNTTYEIASSIKDGLLSSNDKNMIDEMSEYIKYLKMGNLFHVASFISPEHATKYYNSGYGGDESYSSVYRFPYTKILDLLFDESTKDEYDIFINFSLNGMQTISVHWITPSVGNVFTKITDSNKSYMKCTLIYNAYIKNATSINNRNGTFRLNIDLYIGYKKDNSTVYYNNMNNRCSRLPYDYSYTLDSSIIE